MSRRVRLFFGPRDGVPITLECFHDRAPEHSNLGGSAILSNLASLDLGDEPRLSTRWQIPRSSFFLGVAPVASSGCAIDAAVGGDADPLTSLQASLYWFS